MSLHRRYLRVGLGGITGGECFATGPDNDLEPLVG
jgi:hypothetical protein